MDKHDIRIGCSAIVRLPPNDWYWLRQLPILITYYTFTPMAN